MIFLFFDILVERYYFLPEYTLFYLDPSLLLQTFLTLRKSNNKKVFTFAKLKNQLNKPLRLYSHGF